MTRDEDARLAVLETEVAGLRADVSEVKKDVKALITSQATFAGAVGTLRGAVPFVALGVSLGVLILR